MKKFICAFLSFGVNLATFYFFLKGGTLFGWTGALWNYAKMSFIWGALFCSAYAAIRDDNMVCCLQLLVLSIAILVILLDFRNRLIPFVMICILTLFGAVVYWAIFILTWLLRRMPFLSGIAPVFHYGMIIFSGFGAAAAAICLKNRIAESLEWPLHLEIGRRMSDKEEDER